ncbi:hypothetical protein PS623_04421 [Pseudomonas fluorescens]|nr:hypothetical protein PS623_04421 [Pseudomonas fluorescens]
MDNNWLATQQYVQARKELKEAEGRIDELKVLAKWAYISKKQDLLTQSGVGQGLIKAGFDDISGLAQMLLHPIETVKAIGGLIDDPSVLAGYPEEFKQNIKAKVARIENALTVGGDANAEQLGYDIGELVWDVGGLVTGVGGVAKGSVKLATVGIKLSTEKLEQMAERQVVKNLEWKAGKGDYSAKPGGGYGSPSTVTHNGQAVENAGDFSASLPKPAGKVEGGADPKVINPHGELPVVKVNSAGAVKGTPEFEILNNPSARAANTRYELDNGNSFTTNSAGQVDELTFTPVDVKVKRDSRQTEAGKQGRDTDVGGHAQACSQGGTCDGYNLFPQDKNFNVSAYRKFYENVIKKALDDPKQIVGPTTIKFVRSSPDSPRPDMLRVTYTIDGAPRRREFKNEAHSVPEDI